MITKPNVMYLIDMQSFYASVEKAADPSLKDKPVVVAGDPERRSGIILAACPIAKHWGVTTAEALWEAQQKCPHLVVVRPHMQKYIDVSVRITTILETFTDLVEPFSIDEQFLDVTHSLHLFGDKFETARQIQEKIMKETGVYARVGIGPNKVLAKMSCDNFAKRNKEGIFELHEQNIKTVLWPLPIGKMFGVGSKMKRHFLRMGIRTIGHLALYSMAQLKRKWGINGEVLWLRANGIDYSPVTPHSHDTQKAIGHHMTLPRDYKEIAEIKVILLELSEEVGYRARSKGYIGNTVSVGIRGSDLNVPTGFHRQMKLNNSTHFGMDIYKAALRIFNKHWDGQPVRSAGVTLSQLESAQHKQLNLLDLHLRKDELSQAMDKIKQKYGADAIVRAVSLTPAGQAMERAAKIGGHYK